MAVPVQDVAEATIVTLLRGIKKDAAEKNTYIDIVLHTLQQDGITHLAASYVSRTPILFPHTKSYKTQVNLSGELFVCAVKNGC